MADVTGKTHDEILASLEQKARESWHGDEGNDRAEKIRAFLDDKLAHYSKRLGIPEEDLLRTWESNRDYSAINYYQEANFPALDDCVVLQSLAEFKERYPSGKFRCPICEGISTDPYECNSGIERDGKPCDWKAYGLLRTAGKGLRVVVKDDFVTSGKVHEIFMPIEVEAQ